MPRSRRWSSSAAPPACGSGRTIRYCTTNDIAPWHYHKLPEVLGGGTGYEVRTEGEFDRALRAALADRSGMSLIQAHLGRRDASLALERMASRLGPKV
jgi:indolepyruvate decarboxylase